MHKMVLSENHKINKQFERPRRKCEDNIKIWSLRNVWEEDWIYLVQDMKQLRAEEFVAYWPLA